MIPWKPTADLLALAIVTACKATGENPVQCLEGREYGIRAKHYCCHALVHLFGLQHHTEIATYLNVPGKASYFRRSSLWYVLGQNPQRVKYAKADWWDDAVYADLIQVLEDHHQQYGDLLKVDESVHRSAQQRSAEEREKGIRTWLDRVPCEPKARQVRMPPIVGDPILAREEEERSPPHVVITRNPKKTVNIPAPSRIGSSAPIMGGGPPRHDHSLHVKPTEKRLMAQTLADAVRNTQRLNEAAIAAEEGKKRDKGR